MHTNHRHSLTYASVSLAQIKSFFISLFIASTGLVMSPVFLALHLPILTAGLILVVISKTVVVRAAVTCCKWSSIVQDGRNE